MSLSALAFVTAYLGGLAAAVLSPIVGIVLYIMVYHLHPESQWWGESVAFLGQRLSLSVAIATFVGVLIRQPPMLERQRQAPLAYVLAIVLALWALGSFTWGLGVNERGQFQLEKFAKILVFLLLLIRCVRTPKQYHIVVAAWLAGIFYLGYEASGGAGVMTMGRLNEGVGGPDFAESSDLAVHLVAVLPWVGAMFFMATSWIGRGLLLATGALAVNTLIMTRTRNAIVGLAMVTLGCVLALPRGYRVRGVVGVVIGTLCAFQLTDSGWWKRMVSVMEYQSDEAALGRIAYWKAALRMVEEHPLGIGIGNYHRTVLEYVPTLTEERGAHNTFLACLAELGWPGGLLFVGVLVTVLWGLTLAKRRAIQMEPFHPLKYGRLSTRFHLAWHAVGLRAGLLGYFGSALFTTRTFSEDLWLMLGLAMCLDNVSRTMLADAEDERRRSRFAIASPSPIEASPSPAYGPPALRPL